jgi:hypothetical protein
VARGRHANWDELDPSILDAVTAMRDLLPPGIAGWTRENAQWPGMPLADLNVAVDRHELVRGYAAVDGDRFVVALLGQTAPLVTWSRRDATLRFFNTPTSQPTFTRAVTVGEVFEIPQSESFGWLISGNW